PGRRPAAAAAGLPRRADPQRSDELPRPKRALRPHRPGAGAAAPAPARPVRTPGYGRQALATLARRGPTAGGGGIFPLSRFSRTTLAIPSPPGARAFLVNLVYLVAQETLNEHLGPGPEGIRGTEARA